MIDVSVYIDGVDKTDLIVANSLKKTDEINSAPDILRFQIDVHAGQTYTPEADDPIEVYEANDPIDTKIFGGVIIQVETSIDQDSKIVSYDIICRDYGQDLSRQLMIERYESMTVDAIIAAILLKYAPEFDDAFVDAPIDVSSITFNNITVSQALDKLSKLTNYQWYVDYDKSIHFFAVSMEASPFDISDENGNYIPDTFSIKKDLSQIKNRVTVRGGEVEVEDVTFTITGDKGKLQDNGNVTFDLSYKFARKPLVSVNSTPAVIGVVGFDNAADFDAMWSFEQKYLNFTGLMITDTDNIEISGTPLEVIQVRVQDSASIALYGRWDAAFTVPGIKTKDEALQYANAQRDANKDPIYAGSFSTYTAGLRSGQTININSVKLGVNESFFITRVTFQMLTLTTGYWDVEVATARQLTLIDILNRIVGNVETDDLATEGLLSYIEFSDVATAVDGGPVFTSGSGPYQIWPASGSGSGAPFKVNFSTISA